MPQLSDTVIALIVLILAALPACAAWEHVYCTNGGEGQRLDLYPAAKCHPTRGTVLYFHGGGYSQGNHRIGFELRRARLLTE